jgi:hypothetical protein
MYMKKQMALSLIFSLSLIYPTATITQNIQETKSNTTEKWLSRVYAAIWAGTAITETLSLAFAPMNYLLYGNNPASETSKKIIFDVINTTKLSPPFSIKESRSFWTSLEKMYSLIKVHFSLILHSSMIQILPCQTILKKKLSQPQLP